MVQFSDLLRPDLSSLFPGGFQGAHIIGREFWKANLGFLSEILGDDAFDKTLNGVLLPANGVGELHSVLLRIGALMLRPLINSFMK